MAKQELTCDDILKELRAKQYRPIYYLMGEESYYIDLIADYITDNVLSETEKEFNLTVVYGADVEAGDLMMLTDQISSFVPSPLIGKNVDSFGVRFPSMDTIYDLELRKILTKEAKVNDIVLKEGVYLQTTGPAYESPAEVKMFGMFGADAVGMSTAVEAIVGRHMGMRVCGVSCISNMAGGTAANPLSHEEVKEVADRVAPKFKTLVKSAIERMC